MHEIKSYPNVLLVGGTSKNSGKTSLIKAILEKFANVHLCAVKLIYYDNAKDYQKHYPERSEDDFFYVEEEFAVDKDSGRYLKAGACKSYLLVAHTNGLEKLLMFFDELCLTNKLLIVESNFIRTYVKPSIYVLVFRLDKPIKKSAAEHLHKATICLMSSNDTDDFIHQILIESTVDGNCQWKLKT